jgi:hypothetical protein
MGRNGWDFGRVVSTERYRGGQERARKPVHFESVDSPPDFS